MSRPFDPPTCPDCGGHASHLVHGAVASCPASVAGKSGTAEIERAAMDEIVASCMICGQQRKLSIWNASGTGVCAPCRDKAEAAPRGYVLHHRRLGSLFKNRIYSNWADARKAMEGIVWHSREAWEVRPVMVGSFRGVES